MLDEIAEDISKEFKIMKQIEVVWSKEKFSKHLVTILYIIKYIIYILYSTINS